jgi:hypothetical protein
VKVKKIL